VKKGVLILQNYFSSQKGATAVEYVLLVAGIALLIMGSLFAFGEELSGMLAGLSDVTSGSSE